MSTIVIEVGYNYLRAGLSQDAQPLTKVGSNLYRTTQVCLEKGNSDDTEYRKELTALCTKEFHALFFSSVLIKAKDARVVVIEPIMCPQILRSIMMTVLLSVFKVRSITLQSDLFMPILTTGRAYGIVVKIGVDESAAVVIYDHRPIVSSLVFTPTGLAKAKTTFAHALKLALSLEQVPYEQADKIFAGIVCAAPSLSSPSPVDIKLAPMEGICTEPVMLNGSLRMTPVDVLIRGCNAQDYPDEDDEVGGLAGLLLDCIARCDPDVRAAVMDNIVVCGDGAIIPGIAVSLCERATENLTNTNIIHCKNIGGIVNKVEGGALQAIDTGFDPTEIAWIGGSIFGSLPKNSKCFVDNKILHRSHSAPDWLAVDRDSRHVFMF
jgi:hypothetical protein